jgi:hypothetical protein
MAGFRVKAMGTTLDRRGTMSCSTMSRERRTEFSFSPNGSSVWKLF